MAVKKNRWFRPKCYTCYVSFEKMCWGNIEETFVFLKKVNIVGMLLEFNANKMKSWGLSDEVI